MKVAALRTLLPPIPGSIGSPRTPAHGPLTGWVFTLSIDRPVPSCTSTSPFPTLPSLPPMTARGHHQMPLLGFPKIAPPSFPAEESTPAVIARPLKASFHRFETGRTTACLRSAFTVFHRPDGLRLFDPARLLHRAANHGVPGVSKPLQPLPTRRSALRSFLPVPGCPLLACASKWTDVSSPPRLRGVHRTSCLLTLHVMVAHFWEPPYGRIIVGVSRLFSKSGLVPSSSVAGLRQSILPWACCSPSFTRLRGQPSRSSRTSM
jgi:hypothetical protein